MNIIVTFRTRASASETLLFPDRFDSLGASDGRRIANNYLSSIPVMLMIWNIARFSLSRFINRAICYWSSRVSVNGLLKRPLIIAVATRRYRKKDIIELTIFTMILYEQYLKTNKFYLNLTNIYEKVSCNVLQVCFFRTIF